MIGISGRACAANHRLPAASAMRTLTNRTVSRFLLPGLLVAVAMLLSTGPVMAQTPAAGASPPIDFETDIRPIFTQHCLKCHGPDKRSGGLQLDAREFAEAGGDTGGPILGGTLDTNELVRRVASPDRSYRMPKNAPPLTPEELQRIRDWVRQGTPWPDSAGHSPGASGEPLHRRAFDWASDLAAQHEYEYRFMLPYAVFFIVAQILLLALVRIKRAYAQQRPWATGRLRWLGKLASGITPRELLFLWLGLVGGAVVFFLIARQQVLGNRLARLEAGYEKARSPWTRSIFGWPPVPIRPDHPRQVAGTYYRGNCERHADLFNGGNYLTATFRIHLCDDNERAVGVGDPLPPGGLFLRVEIERAPGTADSLFSQQMMSSVFLSEEFYYESKGAALRDRPTRLATLEESQRWAASVPIPLPASSGSRHGLVYLYTGRIDGDKIRGEPHYGIVYDLQFADGKLSADSDLWMNSFGNPTVAAPLHPDKIPFTEWFDYRPIPPIAGENSRDPKLLGTEEYEKKGLIAPPPPPATREDK
jgi:mono/diheme cytochrome c family protein